MPVPMATSSTAPPSPRSPEIFIEERRVHLPVILYNGIIVLGSDFTPEFSFVSDTDVILHYFSISHAFLPMSRSIEPIGISSVRVGDIGDLYFMVLSEDVTNKCHLTCNRETSVEGIRLKTLVDAGFLFF